MAQYKAAPEHTDSHRGLIVLLGIMSALGPMTVDMYLPALPQITRDFATSEAAVQTTLTGSLIGMAVGQLVLGPISDAVGRRWPLIVGLGIHAVFSMLCALAPGIGSLIVFRALQGAGSAAAPAVGMAMIRDIYKGRSASVKYSSILLIATGAPIIAPLIGSGMLLWTDWHGIFIVQGIMSVALVITALIALPETQPIRRSIRESHFGIGLKTVLKDRVFVGSALSQAAMMAASFCYISGLSFVAQDWYGASQQVYGLILSGGAVTMLFMNRLSPWLLKRYAPHRVALTGLAGAIVSALLMMVAAPTLGLLGVSIFSWLCIGFQQLVTPNNQAMGLRGHPARAGIASSVMGAAALVAAAIASPLMGLIGVDNGFAMAVGMFGFYWLSVIASTLVIGFKRPRWDDPQSPIVESVSTPPDSAPELDVSEWIGAPSPLKSLRGRVVLVETFQMLCPGCISYGLPQAQKVQRTLPDVAVIGLHTVFEHHEVTGPSALKVFLSEFRITFPVGIDRHENDPIPVTMRKFALQGTPSTLVFDRSGQLRLSHFGAIDDLALGAVLGRLLNEPAAATATVDE